ncbi:MATE family efflux transporter [Eubacterium limosum]|uniref:MATE family efflux transporter n=1 Tax=Eubacterium limosum TaxID=1736 RepID=UPI001063CAFF|nr:MATE family efflux transporter [Eubacterium limosum]
MEETREIPLKGQMTEGKIGRQLLLFALPLMFSNLCQQLYNTVDAVIVGRFVGANALAAVGASSLLITFMIYFFIGLSIGASVLISQFFGSRKYGKVQEAVHTAVALSLVAGLVLTVLGMAFAPAMLRMMNIPEAGLEYAVPYIRIYFLGMVPMTLYNIGSGILRAVGDSKTPLACLVVTVILNIGLDLLFVGPLGMGVAGAALATALAQLAAAALIIIILLKADPIYRLRPAKIRFHAQVFKDIVRIGLPAGLQSVLVCFSNVVVQSQINTFGLEVMAGFTAYMKIDGFLFMPIDAFCLAISNFVGQNMGAGCWERVVKGKNVCLLLCVGVTIGLGAAIILNARLILGMFTSDETVILNGMRQLYTVVPLYGIYAADQVLVGVLRGAGATVIPMIITLLCMCGLRLGWIFTTLRFVHDARMIYISYPLTWIVTGTVLVLYYYKGGWRPEKAGLKNRKYLKRSY